MECTFCKDNVSMPFTCSLCSQKYCSKHRLPETHECANLGHFDTDTYRKQKLEKARVPRNAISASDISYGSAAGGRGNYWSSGIASKDVLYSGLLVGLIALMPFLASNFSNVILLPGSILYSIFGMFTIYYVRKRTCQKYGMDTHFMFWPIGIAITLIFSLFGGFWILIGYFFIEGEEYGRSRGIVGIISTFTAMGIFLISYLSFIFLPSLDFLGIRVPARIFLIMALLNMFPLWGLDGQKIYEWEPKYYWPMLIFVIITLIIFIF